MRQGVRPLDMVARYGGDEFILLLPNTPRAGARLLAERLRQRVANCHVELRGKQLPAVTISGGVAVCDGAHPVDEVIRYADARLYRAKRAGGNRVFD